MNVSSTALIAHRSGNKAVFSSSSAGTVDVVAAQYGTVSYRGTLTPASTQQILSGASSSKSSQSHIPRRSPNSNSSSMAGVVVAEETDEQSMMSSNSDYLTSSNSPLQQSHHPPPQQQGLLVQYSESHNSYNVTKQKTTTTTSNGGGMATIAEWLNKAPLQNGFIRVFLDPSTELAANSPIPNFPRPTSPGQSIMTKDSNIHTTIGFSSILVPCSLSTTVEQICSMVGISPPSLCVQVNNGKVMKLSPNDRPLQIQTNILAKLGFDLNAPEIMREGIRKSLAFICRFLSAKQSKLALPDVCKRISSYLLVKRPSQVLKTWERRLCSLCGSKLQIHKIDQHPSEIAHSNNAAFVATTVFELAGASVTESNKSASNRSHPYTVKVELASGGSRRVVKLGFDTPEQKMIWSRHLKLASTNQSRSLDLSGSDLELLPEGVFQIADDVQVLNLKDNQLLSRPTSRQNSDDDLSSGGGSTGSQMNPAILGFLDDIARFRNMQILNLSNNDLIEVPKAIYELSNLCDLNLSNNKLREISHLVQKLQK